MYHVLNDLPATFYREPGRHFHDLVKGFDALSVTGFQQQVADFQVDIRVV
jgi:hypothetical protein